MSYPVLNQPFTNPYKTPSEYHFNVAGNTTADTLCSVCGSTNSQSQQVFLSVSTSSDDDYYRHQSLGTISSWGGLVIHWYIYIYTCLIMCFCESVDLISHCLDGSSDDEFSRLCKLQFFKCREFHLFPSTWASISKCIQLVFTFMIGLQEVRLPLQIWVSQTDSGLLTKENLGCTGIRFI
ncbi:hypothetical protein Dimus_031489 [Dionaea muscipula]